MEQVRVENTKSQTVTLVWNVPEENGFEVQHYHVYQVPTAHPYRGTSLIRNSAPLGPYSRHMPRAI